MIDGTMLRLKRLNGVRAVNKVEFTDLREAILLRSYKYNLLSSLLSLNCLFMQKAAIIKFHRVY